MNKLILTLGACAIAGLGYYLGSSSSQEHSPTTQNLKLNKLAPQTQQSTTNDSLELLATKSQQNSASAVELAQESIPAAASNEYTWDTPSDSLSVQEINAHFIKSYSGSEVISKNAISNSFTAHGFQTLMDNLANAEQDHISITRQNALLDKIATLEGASVFNSQVSCAGKICALQITSTKLTQQHQDYIESFGTNYIFNNNATNEHGESILKSVYIQTDDPSQMTLSNN